MAGRDKMARHEIEQIRTTLDLTQAEFAELVGVNQSTVAHWEKGIRSPSGAAMILLRRLEKRAERILEKQAN